MVTQVVQKKNWYLITTKDEYGNIKKIDVREHPEILEQKEVQN